MADDDLITEELERVYRLYGERTRQFRRWLYGLIVAGLAIFLLIVVPFLTFRDQLAEMQANEAALVVELQQARDLVADTGATLEELRAMGRAFRGFAHTRESWDLHQSLLQEAAAHAQALEELRRSFSGWDDEDLAAWLRGEVKRPPDDFIATNRQLYGLAQDPCYWDSGIERAACQLCQALGHENERMAHRMSRLAAVEQAALQSAQDDLAALVARSCGWLTGGDAHWDSGEPLLPDRGDLLRGWFSRDLRAYEERMAALHNSLRRSLPERELDVDRLTRARAELAERLTVLEGHLGRIASFDRIGTPVGDLPVGLGQIVLLFPIAVALGFLIVANGYARSAELQRAFVRLCRKRDRRGDVMDERHLAVIAPLWLDPRESLGARAVKWAVMLTPLALLLANFVLIATTDALTAQLPDDAVISPAGYLLLYAASFALAAGALWYIWRSGHQPPDSTPPATADDA